MNFITRKNYLDYMKKITATMLKEESDEYVLEDFKGTEYNYQKVQEINKKHDKIFKLIFTRKNEVANFLNQYLQLKEVIKEEQLVECSTQFIKEEKSMSPLTKMLFDLELKGEKRGEKKGERNGIIKTLQETAQKMIKKNMKIQDIEEITGLSKEEILKLQKCE